MKYLDGAKDYAAYSDARELEAENATFHLWVSETFEFEIYGMTFQAEVDANVTRQGEHGEFEITDCAFKTICVGLMQFGNPLELNEKNLREDHLLYWTRIEEATDFAILKFASKSTKWEQS